MVIMVLTTTASFAQAVSGDVEADTVAILPRERQSYRPTGLRMGTDLLALIITQQQKRFAGWEVNADVDFGRYYLAFDYGSWANQYTVRNGFYDNNGRYYRVGVDVNFLLKDPDRNMFFLGFRHGRSHYTDSIAYTFTDTNFGIIEKIEVNPGVDARWSEITGGIRIKIWKVIWMGYTARFKFGLKTEGERGVRSYDVPGYGLTIRPSTWGYNYQLFVRLPLPKKK